MEEYGFDLVLRGCQPGPLGGWRLVRGGALIDHTTRTSNWLAAGPKDGPLLQNRGHKDVFGAPGWQPDSADGVAVIVTAVIWPMPDRLNRGILRNEKEGLETIDGSLRGLLAAALDVIAGVHDNHWLYLLSCQLRKGVLQSRK